MEGKEAEVVKADKAVTTEHGKAFGELIPKSSPGSDQGAAKLPLPRYPSVIWNLSLKLLSFLKSFL